MQLNKSFFNVSNSNLSVLLSSAKSIVKHKSCGNFSCERCPFGDNIIDESCVKRFGYFNDDTNTKVDAAKQFIKLFSKENEMKQTEIYKWIQSEWVAQVCLNIGDKVKVIGVCGVNQFGYSGADCSKHYVGEIRVVEYISHNSINLVGIGNFPFFCLEKIPEPQIEITVKINGKEAKLKDISEETLKRIRNM